jgi:hypothetical protein
MVTDEKKCQRYIYTSADRSHGWFGSGCGQGRAGLGALAQNVTTNT